MKRILLVLLILGPLTFGRADATTILIFKIIAPNPAYLSLVQCSPPISQPIKVEPNCVSQHFNGSLAHPSSAPLLGEPYKTCAYPSTVSGQYDSLKTYPDAYFAVIPSGGWATHFRLTAVGTGVPKLIFLKENRFKSRCEIVQNADFARPDQLVSQFQGAVSSEATHVMVFLVSGSSLPNNTITLKFCGGECPNP